MRTYCVQSPELLKMWVHDKEIYISKKCVSSHCQYQSKKALFTNPISSEGFACTLEIRTAAATAAAKQLTILFDESHEQKKDRHQNIVAQQ